MGSSVSSHDKHRDSQEISKTEKMQKTITQQFIPTSGNPTTQSSFSPKPLKGILKNKTNQKIEKPVKIVELYVLRGSEWSVTRVREDEVNNRKKDLKSDKTVKRVYSKPTHDQTFLHFQPF